MTLDTPIITQIVFGGLVSLMLWLLRDKVGGVQKTLEHLTIAIESLKRADAQTDKEVALHDNRIKELERKAESHGDELNKHRSALGDFLTKKLRDLEDAILQRVDRKLEDFGRKRARRG